MNFKKPFPAQPFKDKKFSIAFYELMVRTRMLEERLIRMSKAGEGFFWIGGPGEEAFNVALGLLVEKGEGPAYDYLHLHYRSNGVALAMGAPMVDFVRQMKCSAQDPFSGGRNFVSHIARREWNIVPVTSTIETQYVVAPGTARAQWRLRQKGKKSGVSVVVGGDAGSAEGDFASCLIWSSRPGEELPMLIVVTNNQYGISTPANTQHGEKRIADRAKAFQIQSAIADGTSPEKIWSALADALDYVRDSGKPFMLEVSTSRLYGHSSSSGANRVDEVCCIEGFEKKLLKNAWLTVERIEEIKAAALKEASDAWLETRSEAYPEGSTVLDHSFAKGQRAGLPGKDC